MSWVLQRIYNRVDSNGKIVPRKWITIECIDETVVKALYCTICIAFNTSTLLNNFITGCTNFKNVYSAIESHENSKGHSLAVEAYLLAINQNNIEFAVSRDMMNLRKEQVMERVHVIKQVFEIIKFIGKQNLSYRGTKEGLYNLEDLNMNHGNFLELLKFTAERDSVLKKYLTEAIQRSKQRKENIELKSQGRGSLITLLSKTTVNKVIAAILVNMRQIIKNELGDRQFSIQVNIIISVISSIN